MAEKPPFNSLLFSANSSSPFDDLGAPSFVIPPPVVPDEKKSAESKFAILMS